MQHLNLKYLESLATQYPNIARASTEIINLQAILNLPKETEHFVSDIHGEYEQFLHILRNGSGAIRNKIEDVFGNTLSARDKKSLAALVYYPEQKVERMKMELSHEDLLDWYKVSLNRLIAVCKESSAKYTRSRLRKSFPPDFSYILEELLSENNRVVQKEQYYNEIFDTIIRINRAKEFIVAISQTIQRLVVTRLHVIGDIFDRGPGPHIIMDHLMQLENVDFQWGNHDMVWMGAASGHEACIANVIRLSARYNNLDVLEDGYGINLVPLASFAIETYRDDPCDCFGVHAEDHHDPREVSLNKKMHKAIAVIQFKLEGQVIKKRPEFNMDNRMLLHKIDYEKGTITIDGKTYELLDKSFPTIDPADPYRLSPEEESLMKRLRMNFRNCDKLQEHVRFLFNKGSMYLCYNSNLLYHGCVPLDENGYFRKVKLGSREYSGKELYDVLEYYARKGYYEQDNQEEHEYGKDIMWYIWSNENSPVYGKEKMATFERYFIDDKAIQEEKKDYYYKLIEKEEVANRILTEFGMDTEHSHIINGHMPVKTVQGESPVKCGGKVMIIDGGFSRAYRRTTGIAGYTLIYNSYGLRLVSHNTFTSTEDVIENEIDVHSDTVITELSSHRERVRDTENGKKIKEKIKDLEELLHAYRSGLILEQV
ncbi:Fructose-1,6-bisphosphatase class 3 [Eubacteriaceae bacterium CHKCI004]|nr:Fructose-1,6-bisphosphatase class 3 [Eubacteriaceae bacterium CHKCI004]